jgi:hypothetical protein
VCVELAAGLTGAVILERTDAGLVLKERAPAVGADEIIAATTEARLIADPETPEMAIT